MQETEVFMVLLDKKIFQQSTRDAELCARKEKHRQKHMDISQWTQSANKSNMKLLKQYFTFGTLLTRFFQHDQHKQRNYLFMLPTAAKVDF